MIRPHSSHNTHWWGSVSCNGCHMKIHLSPHWGTLPTHKIIISTETFLSAENYTHTNTHSLYAKKEKQRERERKENREKPISKTKVWQHPFTVMPHELISLRKTLCFGALCYWVSVVWYVVCGPLIWYLNNNSQCRCQCLQKASLFSFPSVLKWKRGLKFLTYSMTFFLRTHCIKKTMPAANDYTGFLRLTPKEIWEFEKSDNRFPVGVWYSLFYIFER